MDNQLLQPSVCPLTHSNVGLKGAGVGTSGETRSGGLGTEAGGWEDGEGVRSLLSEINGRNCGVRADLLLGTSITAGMRAKLRCWISGEGAGRQLSRRCCCLAGTMVDLYLGRGGTVEVEALQMLGLSSLLLANKLTDNRRVAVDWRVFPCSKIASTQMSICQRLEFKLTPVGYVDLLDGLLVAWNDFAKRRNLWVYSLSNSSSFNSSKLDCRFFYELADLAYLILRSFDFTMMDLVLQILKIGLNEDYNNHMPQPKPIEDEVLISFWNNPEEGLLVLEGFQDLFIAFMSELNLTLTTNRQLDSYVTSFLLQGFSPSQTICPNPSYLQTHNPSSLPLSRLLLSPRRNHRKSSSETTS